MKTMVTKRSPQCIVLAIALLVQLMSGCGGDDGLFRQSISGLVTLDGVPLAGGSILFEPTTEASGTAVGATIRQGMFVISRAEGPAPGTYRVRIYSSSNAQAPPRKGQGDRAPRPMVERLPAHYNAKSDLRAEVFVDHANPFRFALQSGTDDAVR
jgi:hypothetical protein